MLNVYVNSFTVFTLSDLIAKQANILLGSLVPTQNYIFISFFFLQDSRDGL